MATDTHSASPAASSAASPAPSPIAARAVAPGDSLEPSPLTYQHLVRNIANVTAEGAQVRVLWRDVRSAALAGESAASMVADGSIGGRMRVTMKRSIVQEIAATLMRALMRALSGVLGEAAGRVVRDVAYSASYDLQSRALAGVAFTEDSRQDAVLRAFSEVRARFVWDAHAGGFVVRPNAIS